MSYSSVVFPHHKLDAYNVSVEFAVAVRALIERMPRGNANLSDQLSRASVSTVTNIAEGANRLGTGEKRQKFSIARGEVGEAAACIELAAALVLAGRIAAPCTRARRLPTPSTASDEPPSTRNDHEHDARKRNSLHPRRQIPEPGAGTERDCATRNPLLSPAASRDRPSHRDA